MTTLPALQVRGLDIPILGMAVMIDVLGMIYGACMGLFALTGSGSGSVMQIPASMVKVPALYLLTLAVTLPSLYVFNALLNSRLSLPSTTRLLICSLVIMLAVLSSGGPIVAFFSLCTSSYVFMVLLNVIVFSIAGVFGLAFLLQTLHRMTLAIELPAPDDRTNPIPEGSPAAFNPALFQPTWERRSTRNVFRIWLVVFALVGAQMGWVLRPFIGHPGTPFSWFRPKESNFFEAVVSDVQQLFDNESANDNRRPR